jgi:hypothetical protein
MVFNLIPIATGDAKVNPMDERRRYRDRVLCPSVIISRVIHVMERGMEDNLVGMALGFI